MIEPKYRDLSDAEMTALGVTRDDSNSAVEAAENEDGETYPLYYDRDGNQHEGWERVLVPRTGGGTDDAA